MNTTLRAALAILAGMVLWALLWNASWMAVKTMNRAVIGRIVFNVFLQRCNSNRSCAVDGISGWSRADAGWSQGRFSTRSFIIAV